MSQPPFDAAKTRWVTVKAPGFFFEPQCFELTPEGPGSLVVVFGDEEDRDGGLDVMLVDGLAIVSVPVGARVFWLPERVDSNGLNLNNPWEGRLQELDPTTGLPLTRYTD